MAERATIEIDAEVLESARRAAERRHLALEEFIEETLRAAAKSDDVEREGTASGWTFRVFDPSKPGTLPGVPPLHHNAELREFLDRGEPEEKLR